jgi:hypothetical protein
MIPVSSVVVQFERPIVEIVATIGVVEDRYADQGGQTGCSGNRAE